MEGGRHRQAGLPRELADAIDDLVRAHPWLGHRSLSGFATEACSRLLRACYEDVERRDRVRQCTDGSGGAGGEPLRRASNQDSPT